MSWIEEELEEADFGDERLSRRGKQILGSLSNSPESSIPKACDGWSETIAAYRFFKNDKVTAEEILSSHKEQTLLRISQQKVALLIQDTTELDYTKKQNKLEGLGVLNKEKRYGMHLHPLVAFSPDKLCLGVVSAQILIREPGTLGSSRKRLHRNKAIEDKESYRWLEGYREANEVAELVPGTQIVMMADREGDIYEIFQEASSLDNRKADFLIRSNHNRALAKNSSDETYLYESTVSKKPLGNLEFELPARAGRKARTVKLSVYSSIQTLRAPPRPKGHKLSSQTISIIVAREENPPKGEEPIEWRLITNLPAKYINQAAKLISWYAARWCIEVFFRTFKTGCRIEELQFKDYEHLAPCLAMYMIIAWRILFITHFHRQSPEISCEVIFNEAEWKAAYIVSTNKLPPKTIPSIAEMTKMIASFGGYLGRKNDPPPGPQALWIGLERVRYFAWGQAAILQAHAR